MPASLSKANWYLRLFGLTKIPLVFFCRPEILVNDGQRTVVKIRLRRRTKNHLGSMYFGALAVGADITGAFTIFEKAKDKGLKASVAFKDFKAEYHKMAMGDVHFECNDGELMDQMLDESQQTGARINKTVRVSATCPDIEHEPVASFELTLSVRVK